MNVVLVASQLLGVLGNVGFVLFSTNVVDVAPLLLQVTSHLPVPLKATVLLVAPLLVILIVALCEPALVGE
jgi:hypothetical protein